MPNYSYRGVDEKQKKVKGKIAAITEQEAYKALKEKNIIALELNEIAGVKATSMHKLNAKELSEFSRQIGTMQAAGISVIKAIQIMKDKGSNKKVLKVYEYLYDSINRGNTLSQSMIQCEECFPKLMINMYSAGEMSGRLDETAIKMAKYYESENKVNTKIRNAMAYPTALAAVTVAVVLILFTFVLPVFFEMYESSGTELNILTRMLQSGSDFLIANWWILLIITLIVVIVGRQVVKMPPIALEIDRIKLKLPVIGPLLSIIYTSRFARTMSSLYSSGIQMIDAVETGAKTIGNRYLEAQFDKVVEKIRSGQPLSYSMEGVKGIEAKLNASIYIGEESGRLDSMLNSISDEYEFEADAAVERLLTYLEPMMIVIMACIIGPILVAVMLPMFNMYSLI